MNIMFNTRKPRPPLEVRRLVRSGLACVLALCCASTQAEMSGEELSVPLSDPSRPATVKVTLVNGRITVQGYEGKEVMVETNAQPGDLSGGKGRMRRIPMASGLSIEEENNEVQIREDSPQRPTHLTIRVPHRTSLILHATNESISVSEVEGDIEVDSVNGSVTLSNVSGAAIAHVQNGRVRATFKDINPRKPMAFSSVNGDIDVSFPADLKANLNLCSGNGEIYSDFEVKLEGSAGQLTGGARNQGGRYRIHLDKTIHGTIHGGGQEIQLTNLNGNIYLRKAGNGD